MSHQYGILQIIQLDANQHILTNMVEFRLSILKRNDYKVQGQGLRDELLS